MLILGVYTLPSLNFSLVSIWGSRNLGSPCDGSGKPVCSFLPFAILEGCSYNVTARSLLVTKNHRIQIEANPRWIYRSTQEWDLESRGNMIERYWKQRQLQTQSWQEEIFAEFLKGSDLTDLLLGDPEIDNEESGSIKLCCADNLNEFEPYMSCIFKVKNRHMQNADKLWMVVSGFAAKRSSYSIFCPSSKLSRCEWSLKKCRCYSRPTTFQSWDERWCSVLMVTKWSALTRGRPTSRS